MRVDLRDAHARLVEVEQEAKLAKYLLEVFWQQSAKLTKIAEETSPQLTKLFGPTRKLRQLTRRFPSDLSWSPAQALKTEATFFRS